MAPVAPPVEGRRWLAPDPLSPTVVDGRVVVITFWSFGCEASIRAVERLGELAARWPRQVAVLAVHTPRFPYEDDEERLRRAIARHRIGVPVVHDPDYLTWNRYNPTGWPATAVIDRAGRVVGMVGGLDGFDTVAEAVATELSRPTGRRDRDRADAPPRRRRRPPLVASIPEEPTRLRPSWIDDIERRRTDTTLWFPSAVALSPSGRLAVADSGNDRLLIGVLDDDHRTFRPEVELTDVDDPTAVTFAGDSLLYVIERGTNGVLQIDLAAGTVDVVADEELEIPTDLIVDLDGSLVVSDAGLDQLIRIVGGSNDEVVIGPIAGRGTTGCRDGAAERAELAQPVALARTARGIAFCDAASSNVRLLTDDGTVLTVTGNEFFDWGLVDGPAHRARLQRPGGLAVAADGSLVVADTGNGRIRVVADRSIRTLGLAGLDQPTGVAVLGSGHLLVADTGNHRLVVADPDGRSAWPLSVYPPTMTSVWEDQPAGAGPAERRGPSDR
jgi:DNA-binding beta-propeller fold protein YncE